jgi:SpoIID/LytB domain protein
MSLGLSAPAAHAADETITAVNSTVTIVTSGWGHGIGMSQYGAYGMAKAGKKFGEILDFYYPGTSQDTISTSSTLDVWISADNDNILHFYPASGLQVRDTTGKTKVLPTGSKYKLWRIKRVSGKRVMYYKNASGKWVKYSTGLNAKKWWYVTTKAGTVKIQLPGGSTRTYRGEMIYKLYNGGAITMNRVKMEDYLRSVVPSEMPASWSSEAVKAQAVAARSYAARYKQNVATSKPYDICDTTSCQAYYGTSKEYSASDSAVKATAGIILKYKDTIAYTMFSSSNGGWSAKGDYPYLTAHEDPYDDDMLNQYRLVTLTASAIQKKYTTIGTFKSFTFKRDGNGPWGGRITEVKITGSKGSKTVTGSSFKSTFGLRERLLIAVGGLATSSANYKRWVDTKQVNGAIGVPTGSETVIGSGLYAPFTGGGLYTADNKKSYLLTGSVWDAYIGDGGAAKSALGWPTSDVTTFSDDIVEGMSKGVRATFAKGLISCPAADSDAADCVISYG